MKLIKRKSQDIKETRITFEYSDWTDELEEMLNLITKSKKTIVGYTQDKTVSIIRLSDILYFEAVGELVFAYTSTKMYDIKMRLYQVEEYVGQNNILRASKSILLNLNKVESFRSAQNGRIIATIENGEEIIVSRSYAKNIVNCLKSA